MDAPTGELEIFSLSVETFGVDVCTVEFCLIGVFSMLSCILRIPIKNMVSLERTFAESFITSILTLYNLPFHLRKHLKQPTGDMRDLSKFSRMTLLDCNSMPGK